MTQIPDKQSFADDQIDIRELVLALWQGKWLIVICVIVFGIIGAAYAFSQPNIYKATALLAPAQNEGGSRLGGQLSGLASLAGVDLGGGETNTTAIAKEVLQSRAFLTRFIRKHGLEAPLLATKGWDPKTQEWEYDPELYDYESAEWLQYENVKGAMPSAWDLVVAFREKLNMVDNKDNGMITLSLSSLSPKAAKEWVDWLIRDINEHMREQDVEEAEARVEYLEDKLSETSIAGMQQVFYQLIESETRTIMLASAQREYVFRIIDPAVIPQEPSKPKRITIVVIAVMLGLFLGFLIVSLKQLMFRPS